MRQKRADVDLSFGLLFFRRLYVVDDGDTPVPISQDIESDIFFDMIRVLEHAANFRETVPPGSFNYAHRCFDLVRRIGYRLVASLRCLRVTICTGL
jgi:hypothetical protein